MRLFLQVIAKDIPEVVALLTDLNDQVYLNHFCKVQTPKLREKIAVNLFSLSQGSESMKWWSTSEVFILTLSVDNITLYL